LKTGLTINKFHPSKKFCNGQTQQKESFREIQRDAICNNMQSMASFILGERQEKRMRACKTGMKEGKRNEIRTEKTTKQITLVFKS
jgi:hypothetical protein